MRILLTGATGFLGRALHQALAARGHRVIAAVRHPAPGSDAVEVDFAAVPSRDWWLRQLAGVDVVINAVGILRESAAQRFDALHTQAPLELFHACAQAGVGLVVQVSALGADPQARSAYHLSKKAADEVLRSLPLRSVIVQPSVVYGPGGASAALFNRMAVAPVLPLPDGGRMQVQPVHVDDLVDGIVRLVESPPDGCSTIAFVGPRPLRLRDYLAALRGALGWRARLWTLPVPVPLFRAGAAVAARLPGSLLDTETAEMLLRGNAAPVDGLARVLGRAPREVSAFLGPGTRDLMRRAAVLDLWAPVLRVAIALVWLWTAVVSAGLYPVQDSLDLLARVGLHGALAGVALYGAAALDLALGVLTLAAPARWRGAVWAAQLLLIAGYTALITLFLPEQWLHPYGPISKNLPMMAAIALLWALEPARGRK